MPVITRSQRKANQAKAVKEEANQAKAVKEQSNQAKAVNNERIIKTRRQRIQEKEQKEKEQKEKEQKEKEQKEQEQKEKEEHMKEWDNWFLNYLNKTIKNMNDVQVRFANNENESEQKQMEKLRIHIELFHLINTSFEYDENSEIEIQKEVTRLIYKKSIELYNKTVCKLNKKFINEEEMKPLIKSALYEFQLTQDMVIKSRNK
jgi:hypothetical protein